MKPETIKKRVVGRLVKNYLVNQEKAEYLFEINHKFFSYLPPSKMADAIFVTR